MFIKGHGDWTQYRQSLGISPDAEVDLHFGRRDPWTPYEAVMAKVKEKVLNRLKDAQEHRLSYLMFVHGSSTSRRGKTTARSVVRSFMRSKDATPLIERSGCIQHETVFIAKIRPNDRRLRLAGAA